LLRAGSQPTGPYTSACRPATLRGRIDLTKVDGRAEDPLQEVLADMFVESPSVAHVVGRYQIDLRRLT
jgi:hypothetical protein